MADLRTVPDAEPRVEAIRSGGPNKPYEVLGRTYVPLVKDDPVIERGLASWYGRKFHGRRTASGEVYNMLAMTAAHKTMPIPSYARVRNPANGREVIVRVNDRGPFSSDRIIDLSYAAAVKLGVQGGVAPVELERITHDEIRAGLATRPAGGGASGTESGGPVAALSTAPSVSAVASPGGPSLVAASPGLPVASGGPVTAPAGGGSPLVVAGATATAAGQGSGSAITTPIAAAADLSGVTTPLPPLPPATQVPGPTPDRARAYTPTAVGFWLQLGAFGRGEGAYTFQQRVAKELEWLSPLLTVFADGGLHRLQAGPYASREQARVAADRVRGELQLVPVIVERR